MKTKIIMVRHGYSISNKEKFFTGNMDIELSELGIKQAEMCGDYLKDKGIDHIYSSDLSRAYNTAIPISKATGKDIKKEKALREIYAGDWEGVPFDVLAEKYPTEYAIWKDDIGKAVCTNGESVVEFSKRIINIVTSLSEKHTGETICITTHATPIRVMCTLASNIPIEDMSKVKWVRNASVNTFEYENGIFRAISLDYADHLGDISTGLPSNV